MNVDRTDLALHDTEQKLGRIETSLSKQRTWAAGVDQQLAGLAAFKSGYVSDVNRINNDLVTLEKALQSLQSQPPFAADELAAHLTELVEQLTAARHAEMNARQVAKDAKESYELAVVFALAEANGATDGKNAETRKVQQDKYLAEHADVRREKAAWDAAQMTLEQAQVDLRVIEDSFTATRAAAGLMAAQLQYMSGR
jgi:hypothetical protein